MPDRSARSAVTSEELLRYLNDAKFHAAVRLVASHLEVHTTTAIRTVVEVEGLLGGVPPVVTDSPLVAQLRALTTTANVPPSLPVRFDV